MRYFLITLLFASLLIARLGAIGGSGANFLRLEQGARPLGMGGAFVGLADDADAVYWNPAGLSRLRYPQLTFTHYQGIADLTSEFFSLAIPTEKWGGFGLNILYSSVEDLKHYNSFGVEVGEIENYDLALETSWGDRFHPLFSAGAGMKYYFSRLEEVHAWGYAMDFGLIHYLPWSGATFGMALRNLGPGICYLAAADPLPLNLKLGPAVKRHLRGRHWLTLSMEMDRILLSGENSYIQAGFEYAYGRICFLRGGYRFGRDNDYYSLGMGCGLKPVWVDYVYIPYGPIGMTHRVSLTLGWPKGKKELPRIFRKRTARPVAYLTGEERMVLPRQSIQLKAEVISLAEVIDWQLSLEDWRGKVVREFTGQGVPPAAILWYGKNINGQLVVSGRYTGKFSVRDRNGRRGTAQRDYHLLEVEEVVMRLPAAVLFDSGHIELRAAGKARLREIYQEITGKYPGCRLRVEGHSDNVPLRPGGPARDNQELSERRAGSVGEVLREFGFPAARLGIVGFGSLRPIATNDNDADRARNRRVELVVEKSAAVTKLPPIIGSDLTLDGKGSPYLVDGDVLVQAGATLTVEAGVVIKFASGSYGEATASSTVSSDLIVLGGLRAVGEAGRPVVFIGSEGGAWGAIFFGRGAGEDCLLEHCRLERGKIVCNYASPGIRRCVIREGGGIEVGHKAAPIIEGNLLEKNSSGILCWFDSSRLSLRYNTISGNKYGLVLRGIGEAAVENNNICANQIDLANMTTQNVRLANNWWGSTDVFEIKRNVHDGEDDAGKGLVIVEPVLQEAVR